MLSATDFLAFASCGNNGENSFSTSASDQSEVKAKAEQSIEQGNNGCNLSATGEFAVCVLL